jgi:predicted O-methyltransferase YrrM
MSMPVEQYFPVLSESWHLSPGDLQQYWKDLQSEMSLLGDLNAAIRDVPEFDGVQFHHVNDLRAYRCLLYLFVRAIKPTLMVETGVQNGFSSSFLLQGFAHNGTGKLVSIDMPPVEQRIIEQGTRPLPQTKTPGWAISSDLGSRHQLLLGSAEELLPKVFLEHQQVDAFLHDSDHCYSHMMFEMGLAWRFLRPGGWLLADNVEQNLAFEHFTAGVGVNGFVVASFDTPERTWRHGLCEKPVV